MTHLWKDLSNINSCLLSYLAQGGVLPTSQSCTKRGCLKPKFLPSAGPGIVLYKPVSALAAQNAAPRWQKQGHQALVGNAGPWVLPQTYETPICILTGSESECCI